MAKQVYPTYLEPDYEDLERRNKAFLSALIQAYPITANELVRDKHRQAEQEAHQRCLVLEDHITRVENKIDEARHIATKLLNKGPAREIIDEVAEEYGVTPAEIVGRRRMKKIVAARQEAMRRVVNKLGYSLPRVGKIFDRDHTTVLHALRKDSAVEGAA